MIVERAPLTIPVETLDMLGGGPEQWTSPEGMASSSASVAAVDGAQSGSSDSADDDLLCADHYRVGLAPSGDWLQSLPPSQVMTSVAMFMTLFVMTPVWKRVYDEAIGPYTDPDGLDDAGRSLRGWIDSHSRVHVAADRHHRQPR